MGYRFQQNDNVNDAWQKCVLHSNKINHWHFFKVICIAIFHKSISSSPLCMLICTNALTYKHECIFVVFPFHAEVVINNAEYIVILISLEGNLEHDVYT